MNQFSILLYLAHVCGAISVLSVIGLIFTLFSGVILLIVYFNADTNYNRTTGEYEKNPLPKWMPRTVLASLGVFATLVVAVPGSETVYAIAASQFGESVLKSEIGTKAEKALEAWLDRQINNEKDDKK